jgi:hypothetical protein
MQPCEGAAIARVGPTGTHRRQGSARSVGQSGAEGTLEPRAAPRRPLRLLGGSSIGEGLIATAWLSGSCRDQVGLRGRESPDVAPRRPDPADAQAAHATLLSDPIVIT